MWSRKVTNPKQMECLVLGLEQHDYMARVRGKKGVGKTVVRAFWKDMATKLNSLGPPIRDGNGWLKVWNDQKYLVKQKVKRSNDEIKGVFEKPYKSVILNSLEETIAKILRLRDVNPLESEIQIKTDISEESIMDESPDNGAKQDYEEKQDHEEKQDNEAGQDDEGEQENEEGPDDNFLLSELISAETVQTITNVCGSVERRIEAQTAVQKLILEEQRLTNRLLSKILRQKEEKQNLLKKELLEKQKFEKRILELKINYHDQLDKDFFNA